MVLEVDEALLVLTRHVPRRHLRAAPSVDECPRNSQAAHDPDGHDEAAQRTAATGHGDGARGARVYVGRLAYCDILCGLGLRLDAEPDEKEDERCDEHEQVGVIPGALEKEEPICVEPEHNVRREDGQDGNGEAVDRGPSGAAELDEEHADVDHRGE
eukprot:5069910-Prymnesium_polylepis.1